MNIRHSAGDFAIIPAMVFLGLFIVRSCNASGIRTVETVISSNPQDDSVRANRLHSAFTLRLKHNLQQSRSAIVETFEPVRTILQRSDGADERRDLKSSVRHESDDSLVFPR